MPDPTQIFDTQTFLTRPGPGRSVVPTRRGVNIFLQGDICDSLFYIWEGRVKLTVASTGGKEGVVGLLCPRSFVGEECLSHAQHFRSTTATAVTDSVLLRITKSEMIRTLKEEPAMAAMFVTYLLMRSNRIQADLVDQLFNSSEKRLARTLLLLANADQAGGLVALVPPMSQETLAEMVGCTRSRVNFFLNRFRRLGFIEYADRIQVNKTLEQIILED